MNVAAEICLESTEICWYSGGGEDLPSFRIDLVVNWQIAAVADICLDPLQF